MPQFSAKWGIMGRSSEQITNYAAKIKMLNGQIDAISKNLPFSSAVSSNIRSKLKQDNSRLNHLSNKMDLLGQTVKNVANTYKNTEYRLLNNEYCDVYSFRKNQKNNFGKYSSSFRNKAASNETGTVFGLNNSNNFCLFSNENVFGKLGASAVAGCAGLSIFGITAKAKSKTTIEYKDGKIQELGVNSEAEIGFSALKGSVKGNNGIVSGSAEGSFVNARAKGSVNATLFKNGKLSPEISAEASAKVSLFEGKAETKIGDDDNNVHGNASAEILSAGAHANLNVGKISYTDANGIKHNTVGAKVEAGAEAYAAQGTVSGGFTICGIKIDASLTGKAGGAGVKASGSVTAGGVSGEIGAGLGLGAGLKVNVDWTNFNLKKLFG